MESISNNTAVTMAVNIIESTANLVVESGGAIVEAAQHQLEQLGVNESQHFTLAVTVTVIFAATVLTTIAYVASSRTQGAKKGEDKSVREVESDDARGKSAVVGNMDSSDEEVEIAQQEDEPVREVAVDSKGKNPVDEDSDSSDGEIEIAQQEDEDRSFVDSKPKAPVGGRRVSEAEEDAQWMKQLIENKPLWAFYNVLWELAKSERNFFGKLIDKVCSDRSSVVFSPFKKINSESADETDQVVEAMRLHGFALLQEAMANETAPTFLEGRMTSADLLALVEDTEEYKAIAEASSRDVS